MLIPASHKLIGVELDGFGVNYLFFLNSDSADCYLLNVDTTLPTGPFITHELITEVPSRGPVPADTGAGCFIVENCWTVLIGAEHVEATAVDERGAAWMFGKAHIFMVVDGFEGDGESIFDGGGAVGGEIGFDVVGEGAVLSEVAFDCLPNSVFGFGGALPLRRLDVAPFLKESGLGYYEGRAEAFVVLPDLAPNLFESPAEAGAGV